MITENLSTLKIHKLTQAQYERELEAGRIDENALYLTPDETADLDDYATKEYVDSSIAAIPTPDVSGQINAHNASNNTHSDIRDSINTHTNNKSNPHGVTLTQLGVTATATELNYIDGVTSGVQAQLDAKASNSSLTSHTNNKSNPHGVTAAQVGALPIAGGDITGGLGVAGKVTQGSPSTDGTVTNMNRFHSDLFVQGDGSAPNNPKAAGFYLGKSQSDENRHMDIVSGDTYSYIDFNKADNNLDYDARILVNVATGYTEFMWDGSKSNKQLNIAGNLLQHGQQVALQSSIPTTAAQVGAAPAYTYGTSDLTAGSSALETGKLYFVYE